MQSNAEQGVEVSHEESVSDISRELVTRGVITQILSKPPITLTIVSVQAVSSIRNPLTVIAERPRRTVFILGLLVRCGRGRPEIGSEEIRSDKRSWRQE